MPHLRKRGGVPSFALRLATAVHGWRRLVVPNTCPSQSVPGCLRLGVVGDPRRFGVARPGSGCPACVVDRLSEAECMEPLVNGELGRLVYTNQPVRAHGAAGHVQDRRGVDCIGDVGPGPVLSVVTQSFREAGRLSCRHAVIRHILLPAGHSPMNNPSKQAAFHVRTQLFANFVTRRTFPH